MFRTLFFVYFFSFQLVSFAQLPEVHARKIKDLLGPSFQELKPKTSYPHAEICAGCEIVPSRTFYKDTTGIVYQNQFLLFRQPISYTSGSEILKLIQVQHLTNAEYNAFQEYVRDSIAREKLFFSLEDDRKALEFLVVDESKVDIYGHKGPYGAKRELDRQKFPLNWDKKFSYSYRYYIPYLADMYLPTPQRYYRQKTFDDRKFGYRYTDYFNTELKSWLYKHQTANFATNVTPTFSNSYLWSSQSKYDRDVWHVHGQTYKHLFPSEKLIGITGAQANAFCHWKQQQIQQEVNRLGLNYTIVVSLPVKEDLAQLDAGSEKYVLEAHDYTDLWRISVDDYTKFITEVRDSIFTETLFKRIPLVEDKSELLAIDAPFFDEAGLEYMDFDPAMAEAYRFYFKLQQSGKMERKYASLAEEIRESSSYTDPTFVYWENDAHSRSIVGKLAPDGRWVQGSTRDTMYFEIHEHDSLGYVMGLDFSLDYVNVLGYSTGVRTHVDFRRFYHKKAVNILPAKALTQKKDELIQGLSYEQAVAFYYWKYPIQFAQEGDDWHQYVIPSKEQFEAVQRGETLITPAQEVAYPSPVFRYVVHVFK